MDPRVAFQKVPEYNSHMLFQFLIFVLRVSIFWMSWDFAMPIQTEKNILILLNC